MEEISVEKNHINFTPEYSMWYVNSEAIVIGASEAQHSYVSNIIADSLDMTVYNCGEDGMFFYYQNAIINGILNRYTPKLVIWSIQPSFLTYNLLAKDRIGVLKPFAKENEYCRNMLKIKSVFEPLKVKSNCYVYNSKIMSYIFTCLSKSVIDKNNGYVPSRKKDVLPEIKEAEYTCETDSICMTVFDSTLSRLKRSNVDVVFVFTPSYETGVYDTLICYKDLLQTTNKYHFPVIEDLYHNDVLMRPDLFRDNMHLDEEGSVLFTKMLIGKINVH